MWSANSVTSKILVYLHVTYAPLARRRHLDCKTCSLRTCGRQWKSKRCALSRSSVPDGELTFHIQEETQHTHPLSSPLRDLIDVTWAGESCNKGHPQITSCVDPLDWFPEDYYWSGQDEAPSGTREDQRGARRDKNDNSTFTQPPLNIVEV